MSAFHFGSGTRPLVGLHHEAEGAGRGQVLICQPWGTEYEFAHRTCHFLARRLARCGWHVLRFDYRGTGDSWGDTTEAELDGWLEDVTLAAEELRAISGLQPLTAIGLRLGASLLSLASEAIAPLDRVVLWDLISDGAAWVRELDERFEPASVSGVGEQVCELGQFAVSTSLREDLTRLRVARSAVGNGDGLVLWTTETGAPDHFEVEGERVTSEHLRQPSPWLEHVALGSGQIPVEAVDRIVGWVTA